jgi:uncharacterized membrane protein
MAVSADGRVVVGISAAGDQIRAEPFRWTPEDGMVSLGWLPGHNHARVQDTSADGSVVIGYSIYTDSPSIRSTASWEAFRWSEGQGMVRLGALAGDATSKAYGVTPDGQIVVGSSGDRAVRWDPVFGPVALAPLPGTTKCEAREISADGRVALGVCGGQVARWTPDPSVPTGFPVAHVVQDVAAILTDLGLDLSEWQSISNPLSSAGYGLSVDGSTMASTAQVAAETSILRPWRVTLPSCHDGIDNERDGLTDYPNDPDCPSITSDTERSPACSDGFDNDGDGAIDFPADPGCYAASSTSERSHCDDGIDNDGDGMIDYTPPAGIGADPQCAAAWGRERSAACGLIGVETLPIVAACAWRRVRRRRARAADGSVVVEPLGLRHSG